MPTFGEFETVEVLATRGPFTVYGGRRVGSATAPDVAICVFESADVMGSGGWSTRAAAFLESANVQKSLSEMGARHWAPIHGEPAEVDSFAYYVMPLYSLHLEKWAQQGRATGVQRAAEIKWVARCIAEGLLEARTLMQGRAHGNLHARNVLLIPADGSLQGATVHLADPLPAAKLTSDAPAADLAALGRLIFEMVMRREAPSAGGFAMTSEWKQLGDEDGKRLHALADGLMTPDKAEPLTLEQARDQLAAPVVGKGGVPLGAIAASAAVLGVAACAGWYFFLRNPAPPPPPPPPPDGGACLVLNPSVGIWTCQVSTEAECAQQSGTFLGIGKPCQQAQYLDDPRNGGGWPPSLGEEDRAKWKELRGSAKSRLGGDTELAERFDEPLAALEAEIKALKAIPAWVPTPDSAPTPLSEAQQKDVVDRVKKLKVGFQNLVAVGQSSGSAFAAAKQAIESSKLVVNEANVREKIREVNQISESWKQLEEQFGADRAKSAGYDPDALSKLKADMEEFGRQAAAGDTSQDLATRISRKGQEIEVALTGLDDAKRGLEVELARLIDGAKERLSQDLPADLRQALADQVEKIKQLNVSPKEKMDRAQATDFWARAITKAFEIPDVANLEGVFVGAEFEKILGEQATQARSTFANELSKLPSLPPRDDAAFEKQLAEASRPVEVLVKKVAQFTVPARNILELLAQGALPDEEVGGTSIVNLRKSFAGPDWVLLRPAFAPLEATFAELDQASRGSQKSSDLLETTLQDTGGSEVGRLTRRRLAWNQLMQVAAWPADLSDLQKAMDGAQSLQRNTSALNTPEARKTAIGQDIQSQLRRAWITLVNERNLDDVPRAFEVRAALGIADADLDKLNTRAKFNLALIQMRAEVETLADADVLAFVNKWRNFGTSNDALAKAMERAATGKVGTDWNKVGPALAEWNLVSGEDREGFAEYRKGNQSLIFLQVDNAGSMLCTTEFTIGLLADLVQAAPEETEISLASTARTGNGPSPWVGDGKRITLRPNTSASKGWYFVDAKIAGQNLFPTTPNQPGPTLETPANNLSAAYAMALAHSLGCRLPTVEEWRAAAALAPAAPPNLRDQAFAEALRHSKGFDGKGFTGHFPSSNRFPVGNESTPFDGSLENADGLNGNDGLILFRPVPSRSETFVDLRGNLAEWVTTSGNFDVQQAAPLTKDAIRDLGENDGPLANAVRVIGSSAVSPAAPDDPLPPPARRFRVRNTVFSDVGFRLAFTAEGGGGGRSPAAYLRREIAKISYQRNPGITDRP